MILIYKSQKIQKRPQRLIMENVRVHMIEQILRGTTALAERDYTQELILA